MIDTQQLCLLNTWGSAKGSSCATYRHGAVATQIDLLTVRRSAADHRAKQACPIAFDLSPWKDGNLRAPARPAPSAYSGMC